MNLFTAVRPGIAETQETDSADRETVAQWRQLIALLPVAVCICEAPSGAIVYFNEQAAELWGRAPRVGDPTERFCGSCRMYGPDGRALTHDQTPMAVALREGRPFRNEDSVIEQPDGTRIEIRMNIDPIRDSRGQVIGAVNMFQDVFRDATTLKWARAERALDEQARGALAAIVESSDDAVISKDLRGIMKSWNRGAERLFGYTSQEAIGQPVTMLIPRDRLDEETGILERIGRGERIDHYETVRRRKNGSLVNISLTVSPIIDGLGRVVGASKIARDITERKRAEHALQESESLFHEIADTAPAMLWTTDAAGVRTFLSRRWYEFTGQAADIAPGVAWLSAVHPDDRATTERIFVEAHERRAFFRHEYRVRRAEGDDRWVIESASPRVGEGAEFLGYVGAVVDITERKHAENALREEAHVRETLAHVGASLAGELNADKLLQEMIDAGAALTSAEFGAFFYNVIDDSGEGYLLYTLSGAPNTRSDGFPHPRLTSLFGPTFRAKGTLRIDDVTTEPWYSRNAPYLAGAAAHLPVRSYLAVPVISRSGDVLGGLLFGHSRPGVFQTKHEQLAKDIAAWAALALDNARLYEDAKEANRVKDEFLATLSHELRNPLNAILVWSQVLLSNTQPDLSLVTQGLDAIERNAKAQAKLVEDLLDVSRIVTGKLKIRSDEVDLTSVVSSAMDSQRLAASAKGVQLQITLDPEVQILVTGDADRLRQVVWNLLSNAVKFTPRGGAVRVELRRRDTTAEIVVRDTGEGIGSDFLPHIFERFRQADSTPTRRQGGLGLGLTIVRTLTEAHGGKVTAESPGEGRGATFTVRLPIRSVRSSDQGKPAPQRADEASLALSGIRVLAVDDDSDARSVLRMLLETQGARVTTAESAEKALDIFRRGQFDVLLADIGMPQQDGYSLIKAIRGMGTAQRGDIPAIAVTAYAGIPERHKILQAGYGWHLPKPLDSDRLVALISAAVKSATRPGSLSGVPSST
jgi:PAS domain S-box-containing protein